MSGIFIRFMGLLLCGMWGSGFCFLGRLILLGCGIGLFRVGRVVGGLVRLGIYRRFRRLCMVRNELQH